MYDKKWMFKNIIIDDNDYYNYNIYYFYFILIIRLMIMINIQLIFARLEQNIARLFCCWYLGEYTTGIFEPDDEIVRANLCYVLGL